VGSALLQGRLRCGKSGVVLGDAHLTVVAVDLAGAHQQPAVTVDTLVGGGASEHERAG
jgi:hypothetical protein